MQYLPELLPEDADLKKVGRHSKEPVSPTVQVQLDNTLIAQLLSQRVQSRKLLESSQNQVERMMAQLLDLKIGQAGSARDAEGGAGGGASVSTLSADNGANTTLPNPGTVSEKNWVSSCPVLIWEYSFKHLPSSQ